MKNLTAKEILGNSELWLQIDYQYILKVMHQFATQEVEERDKEIEKFVHSRLFRDEGSELRKLVNKELREIEQFLQNKKQYRKLKDGKKNTLK